MPDFSISQIETLLRKRRKELSALYRERKAIGVRLRTVTGQIASISGSTRQDREGRGPSQGGQRRRNGTSLGALLQRILQKKSGKPMSVSDLAAATRQAGYKSSSRNFLLLVNHTLIKDKRFKSTARGIYALRK